METQKRPLSQRAEALALVFLLACLGALGLHAATQTTNFDPAAATVGNARLLTMAISQYTENYDERLPPTQSVAVFQAAILPYVTDPSVLVSQVTGKPFIPNPAISGQGLAFYTNPSTVELFRDVLSPSNTPATVGFLDGHIERGGVEVDNAPNHSYRNAQTLNLAIIEYEQDADEKYPPMTTQAVFQAALLPFVHRTSFFIDPNNGKPFQPNPALSEVSLASISDPYTTVVFQSAQPYKNGVPTIAYADNHITPTPPHSTSNRDSSNLKQIGLATIQYSQDSDNFLPTTTDYVSFVDELEPFTRTTSLFFSPDTNLPYILNPAISGANIASIPDLSNTEEARDAQINLDGTLNHLELDGHVRQDFFFVPRSFTIAPDDQTHVLWHNANAEIALWTFLPGTVSKSTYTLGHRSNAYTFSVGSDGSTRLLGGGGGYAVGAFNVPITGVIALDILDSKGSSTASIQYGPYDGWRSLFFLTANDTSSRLLWQRYDGILALWTLSPEGNYVGYVTVPTLTDGTPVGMALGKDGLTRLLWKTSTGDALLWTLSANGTVLRSFSASSPHGFTLTGLGLDAGDSSRLLWGDGKDNAVVAAVSGVGGHFFFKEVSFTLPGGGTASQIAVGKAGDLRVLWENADSSGQLQTLTGGGKQTSAVSLTPYQ